MSHSNFFECFGFTKTTAVILHKNLDFVEKYFLPTLRTLCIAWNSKNRHCGLSKAPGHQTH